MKCRRLIRTFAALLIAALLPIRPALAQSNVPQTGTQQTDPQRSVELAKDLQRRFAQMSKRYKLTNAQQTQLRSILLSEQQDGETIFADPYMTGKDKREEQARLFEASQQKVGAILTKKQKRKFNADEKRRAWMEGRLPNPNPGPALNSW